MIPVYFFHGLQGSPQGVKAKFFQERAPEVLVPLLPPSLFQRLELVRGLIQEPSLLIGSSLGGLTALLYALEVPSKVKGLLLIAPAVGFYDPLMGNERERALLAGLRLPGRIPIEILAGRQDKVIPLQAVEDLVRQSPEARARLEVFQSDHSMNSHLEAIWGAYQRLCDGLE